MNNGSRWKKWVVLFSLIPVLLFNSGCIYLVVGGLGVLGGYIVSPDTVEGLTESSPQALWDAVEEIVPIMGTIEEEDKDGGLMTAKISGAAVTITIMPVNETTTRFRVKARRHHLPKISVAQDVYLKVLSYLRE